MPLDAEWLCDSQNVVKIENREKIDKVMVLLKSFAGIFLLQF
jgi:hypothetical protein